MSDARPAGMHDELSVLKLVAGRLEAAGLPYMVTGSVALSLYAEPRMTRDVDLVVELGPSDTTRIAELFGAEFNVDADRIREAIAERSMFNVIHTAAVVKLDIIVRKTGAYRDEEFRRRRLAEVDGVGMWVVSAEDLLLSKLDWARDSRSEVQFRDVCRLIEAQPTLDWTYIDEWAARLGLLELVSLVAEGHQ
jgi:nucleotidyltransferase AbiEii toxin of type IV toxin-antitoxin system